MKNYSYIGISFIVLVFGIWAVNELGKRMSEPDLVFIEKNGQIAEVPHFSFTNQYGETVTNENYDGKVYVVEFFFTTCPTICPIMNRNMVKIQNEFYGNPNLGIASFSIDPSYDTPEVLKDYAESYQITNPNWHLLTGDKEAIYELANTGFNLYVAEAPDVAGGFEHSGFFALIDQEGKIRSRLDENENPIIYYDGTDDEGIRILMEDIEKLLK